MEASSKILLSDTEDIRIQKLSHVVAERLRGQIVSGQLKPGDRLPSETELLGQFKVSRPTLREALRILEVEFLITMGRGARSGAVVLGPSVERAAEYAAMVLVGAGTTVSNMHEARAVLEPALVLQLATQRDPKLFAELQAHLDAGHAAVARADFQGGVAAVNDFHAAMVRASHNRALILIVDMLKVLSQKSVNVLADDAQGGKASLRANMLKTLQVYQQLVDLLREGKTDEAHAFWKSYMQKAQSFLDKSGLGNRRLKHS